MKTMLFGCCADRVSECPIIGLRWRRGRRVIVLTCPKCDKQTTFDLAQLFRSMGDPDLDTEGMLLAEGPSLPC